MGALLEIEVWSALMTFVCPVPKVHGGSAEIKSSECLRQIRKKMWQSLCLLQMRCAVWNEWIFSSNTPEERTCRDRWNTFSDALGVNTCGRFNTNRSQLTILTKARAKKYLGSGCAISYNSFLSCSRSRCPNASCATIFQWEKYQCFIFWNST